MMRILFTYLAMTFNCTAEWSLLEEKKKKSECHLHTQ